MPAPRYIHYIPEIPGMPLEQCTHGELEALYFIAILFAHREGIVQSDRHRAERRLDMETNAPTGTDFAVGIARPGRARLVEGDRCAIGS